MGWSLWFLISYLAAAAWVATAVQIHGSPAGKGRPIRSGFLALVLMWLQPALFIGALFLNGRSK